MLPILVQHGGISDRLSQCLCDYGRGEDSHVEPVGQPANPVEPRQVPGQGNADLSGRVPVSYIGVRFGFIHLFKVDWKRSIHLLPFYLSLLTSR